MSGSRNRRDETHDSPPVLHEILQPPTRAGQGTPIRR